MWFLVLDLKKSVISISLFPFVLALCLQGWSQYILLTATLVTILSRNLMVMISSDFTYWSIVLWNPPDKRRSSITRLINVASLTHWGRDNMAAISLECSLWCECWYRLWYYPFWLVHSVIIWTPIFNPKMPRCHAQSLVVDIENGAWLRKTSLEHYRTNKLE